MQPWCPSGFHAVPQLRWGSHLAHFFAAGSELRDVAVPYFKAGLENNERCLWVTGKAYDAEQARSALRAVVSDLDRRERAGQIEIQNVEHWYAPGQRLRPSDLVNGLLQREQEALSLGYAGLRTQGNCAWVSRDQWPDFMEYERLVHEASSGRNMISMCSYCTEQLRDSAHLEIMEHHHLVVPSASSSTQRGRSSHGTSDAGEPNSGEDGTSSRIRAAEAHFRSRDDGVADGNVALHACRQHLHL